MDKDTQQPELLTRVIQNFENYEDMTRDARDEAELHRDYFDGKQWTDEELKTLKKRKQLAVTDNKVKDKVEYYTGLLITQRTDPKAYPRTPAHAEEAEAITDALRYIVENNEFDNLESEAAENVMVEGDGGLEVTYNPDTDEIEILKNRWDRRYYDPHSLEKDFSDATYLGTTVWMDMKDAKRQYPDSEEAFIFSGEDVSEETHSDKPNDTWLDTDRNRVRITEQYFQKDGVWHHCVFTKMGFLVEPSPSTYVDEHGEPEHPYAWMSAYVDRQGNRYGLLRRFKTLQDEHNHRRSKALHILNNNQLLLERGAVLDINKARKEASKPDGVIEYEKGFELRIEKNNDLSAGQASLMQQASEALSIASPKAVSNTSAQSGRAKMIDRQTDTIEVGRLFDQIRFMKKQAIRKAHNRMRQYWTAEKWIRIRDDEGAPKFVQLNAPITALDRGMELYQQGVMNEALMSQIEANPQAVVGVKNRPAELDVDIILDDAPDSITMQAEQFADLVGLAQAGVIFPPKTYLEASNIRNKDKLLEELEGGSDPQQAQAMAQEQNQAKQIAMAEKAAEIRAKNAKSEKDEADAYQTRLENIAAEAALKGIALEQ